MLYTIEDTTLNGLADVIRLKSTGQVELPVLSVENQRIGYSDAYPYELPSRVKKIKIVGRGEYPNGGNVNGIHGLGIAPGKFEYYQIDKVKEAEGYVVIRERDSQAKELGNKYPFDFEITIEGNAFTFITTLYSSSPEEPRISFEAIGLDENGNEFRYTPLEMIDEINDLVAVPAEAFNITGDCSYKFSRNGWNWFINQSGNKINTVDVTNTNYMFYYTSLLEEIPFDINYKANTTIDLSNMFYECGSLRNIPRLNNCKVNNRAKIFQNCYRLRYFPEGFGEEFDWSYMDTLTSAYNGNSSGMFSSCCSLRKLPMEFLKHGNPNINNGYAIFNGMCDRCHTLDEIIDLPNPHSKSTFTGTGYNSPFYNIVYYCYRLKDFTFAPMDFEVKWSNQVLDFTSGVGYAPQSSYITSYNSGITADKEVKDDATYQALKNDPDWFATKIEYSRYNRASAARTLASLPDTSAYGTNTIKFKGASGSLTDGGAINTLTEEEIAVAAARGWTVSLS